MKVFIAVAICAIAVRADDKYSSKWDNIDLDNILNNKRLLKNYFECLMERGPCTPDGLDLRKVLPEALRTDCAKCTDTQKHGSSRVIQHIYKNEPKMFDELESKYDADGEFRRKFEAGVSFKFD